MNRNFLRLLGLMMMIFLGFSYVLNGVSAIPATRTQNLKDEDTTFLPSLAEVEHVFDDANNKEVLVAIERRIDLETHDYDGTGANRDHEPKPPRRV
ncbi:uncharacterized protein LOC130732557 [Lotus japonicus]|uniref:uncharacterized protein LOC130732557 n=1 Tax=Lotus japonicus TaxID=34305 RepID=UPI00258B909E|nr:uncharacterized protein LOC130732557 [Lotus japonicus]